MFEQADPAFCAYRVIGGLTSGEGLVAALAGRPNARRYVLMMEPEFARLLRVSARSASLSAGSAKRATVTTSHPHPQTTATSHQRECARFAFRLSRADDANSGPSTRLWNALLVFGLVACGASGAGRSATSTTTPASGTMTGRVTAGPTCPVERIGQRCPPRAVVADVQAHIGRRIIGSTRSHAVGTYRLDVQSVSYTLVAVSKSVFPRRAPRTVSVAVGRTARADTSCDIGIR